MTTQTSFVDARYVDTLLVIKQEDVHRIHKHQLIYYIPWTHRTAWIKSLTLCVSCTCLQNKLSFVINFIKKLASWNGFPGFVVKRIIDKVLNTTDESTNNPEPPEILIIYICMSYYSNKGLLLLKYCLYQN